MKPLTIHAKDKDDLKRLSNILLEHKFKLKVDGPNFTFFYKRVYGNWIYHLIFILLACFTSAWFLFGNLIIFLYCFYKKSQYILITTEIEDNGKKIDFDDFSLIDFNRKSFS